jgi:hypothetical protein
VLVAEQCVANNNTLQWYKEMKRRKKSAQRHTHTHTHIYIKGDLDIHKKAPHLKMKGWSYVP